MNNESIILPRNFNKDFSVELRYLSYDTDEISYVVQPNEDIDFYLENITITELNNFIRTEKRKEKILKIKQKIKPLWQF